jgi:hypothetical protein
MFRSVDGFDMMIDARRAVEIEASPGKGGHDASIDARPPSRPCPPYVLTFSTPLSAFVAKSSRSHLEYVPERWPCICC